MCGLRGGRKRDWGGGGGGLEDRAEETRKEESICV